MDKPNKEPTDIFGPTSRIICDVDLDKIARRILQSPRYKEFKKDPIAYLKSFL